MKKSVLSLLAIAIASVSVFTSCDKNDDGYGQSAKPAVQTNTSTSTSTSTGTSSSTGSSTVSAFTFKGKGFFIDDEMAQLGTFKIEVTDGTKTSEYDLVAQGEHCTKTFNSGDDKTTITATGYMLKVVLPTSGSLKFKVTYVPSEKAKSFTAQDRANGVWAVAIGQGNSADINFGFTARKNVGLKGDRILDWGNLVAEHMSE